MMNRWAAADRAIAFSLDWLERMAYGRHAGAPLCSTPLGSRQDYLGRWQQAKSVQYPAVDVFERACGAAIEPAWFHDLALVTQVTQKRSTTCYQHGRLLYALLTRYVRERSVPHVNIVETGTARGFSVLCMARALADAGVAGKIATFDVLPHDARIYWNCIRDADGRSTRSELLAAYADLLERYVVFHRGDARTELRKLSFTRVHFAFLDSAHTYDQVMGEFAGIGRQQRAGDILFFDDYTPHRFPGVVTAADEICQVHGYSRTLLSASADRAYLIAAKR